MLASVVRMLFPCRGVRGLSHFVACDEMLHRWPLLAAASRVLARAPQVPRLHCPLGEPAALIHILSNRISAVACAIDAWSLHQSCIMH